MQCYPYLVSFLYTIPSYIPHFYFPCVILSYGCVSVCMHVRALYTVHSAQEKIDALKVLGADVRPVPAVPSDNYNRQMV